MIITLITAFALLILGLAFVRYKLAIVLYLAYMILVPHLNINLPVWSVSYATINAVLLLVLIYNIKLKNDLSFDFTATKPFIFLLSSLLFITLFTKLVAPFFQVYRLGIDIMIVCVISFIIWNVSINNAKFITQAKWGLIISITIAGVYAILIMPLGGENPYTSFLTNHFGLETDYAMSYVGIEMFRIRNQGTTFHPMTWTFYLSIFSIFSLIFFLKERKLLYLGLLCFVIFNIIVADVRTGLAASILALAYIFVRYNKFSKTILWGTALVVILAFAVTASEELLERFLSMIDTSGTKTNIEGSSITMRLEQFNGCLDIISKSMLMGKGYFWTSYYITEYSMHPIALGFESLIFVVLCNHGIVGAALWAIFAIMLLRIPRKILSVKENVYCVDGLVIFFFAYTVITGIFPDWLSIFAIYYSFILGYLYNEEKKEINCVS